MLAVIGVGQFYAIHNLTITGADQLVYATQGKIFARDALIQYKNSYFDNETKFLYLALHGFSYTLFSTINYLYNYAFNFTGDLYFLNISNYYLVLITLLVFSQLLYYLPKNFRHYAFFGVALFLLSPVIAVLGYSRSIDSYRVFLLFTVAILFNRYLDKKNTPNLVLYGVTLGLSTNSHATGLIFGAITLVSTLVFSNSFRPGLKNFALLLLLTVIFGAYHYPVQIVWGDGWKFGRNYNGVSSNIINIANNAVETITGSEPIKTLTVAQNTAENKPNEAEPMKELFLMPTDTVAREIETTKDFIKNGFLGIFFRFHYFGVFNWLLPILIVVYHKIHKPSNRELILFFNLASIFIIISLEGFSNFRYQFTLLPFFSFLVTIYLFRLFDIKPLKRKMINLIVLLMLILSTINALYTVKNSISSYINKYASKPKVNQNIHRVTESTRDAVKTKATTDVVTFVSKLRVDKRQSMLATGTRLFNYYTDVPTYFMSNANYIYTEDGKVRICPTKDPLASYTSLIRNYNIKYIAIRTTDKINPGCIDRIVTLYAKEIFDSVSYRVYEL